MVLKEEKQQLIDVESKFKAFTDYFEFNKIFFTHDICSVVDELVSKYDEKMKDYVFGKTVLEKGADRKVVQEYLDKSQEAAKFFHKEIPGSLKTIEDEFRKILNVI